MFSDCSISWKCSHICFYISDITVWTVAIILICGRVSYQKPTFQRAATKDYQSCLLECLACVELWGTIYDGNACANGCAITGGKSIDSNCEHGINIRKRFESLKAQDNCKKQCSICVNKLSNVHYNMSKCQQACAQSAEVDLECMRHLNWYDMILQKSDKTWL